MRMPKPLHLAYAACGIAWVVVVFGTATDTFRGPYAVREPTASQEQLDSLAKSTLANLQRRSFEEKRELCGLMLEDEDGQLSVSDIFEGDAATCSFQWVSNPEKFAVASFHTHGSYNDEYDSEVPSTIDLEGDIADRIDGYVSTPGGRMWHIDWQEEATEMICGESCLPADPDYVRCDAAQPAESYTVWELNRRQSYESFDC